MKIIEVVTDDIGDFKTIIEILNGFIPEANVDFIKDADAHAEKLNKKKETRENREDIKTKKTVTNTENKKKRTRKEKIEDSDDDSTKKKRIDAKNKKDKSKSNKNKQDDDNDDIECDDDDCDFKKEDNKGKIKILTADPLQVMITYVVLKGSAFKKFNVLPDKYSVGLNLDELYKYIKNVDKEGTLSIHIDSDDTQHIVFDVKSDNSASQESICELRVLNLTSKKDRVIEAELSMAVRINCQAFHKACKDLLQFSQYVEITCDPSQFVITCKGDLSNHSRIFRADGSQNGIIIKTVKRNDEDDNAPNIIRLVFDLKFINSMYKCSSLCDDMEIYLNNDSVMFLKYGIKLMGEMLVGIVPSNKKREQIDNYDEQYDEYYQDDEEIQLK